MNHQIYDSSILNLTSFWLVKDLLFPYKVVNHLIYLMIKNNHGPVFILKTSIHEYEYEIEDILNESILNPKIKMFL